MPSSGFIIHLPEPWMVNIETLSKAKVSTYPEQRFLINDSFSSMTETKIQKTYWCENAIPGIPETGLQKFLQGWKWAKMNTVKFTRLPREVFHSPRGGQLPASVQAVWQGGWNTPWGGINKGTALKAREGKKSHHARLQSNYSWRTAFNFAHGILSHLLINWRVCRGGTQNDEGIILWGVLKGTEHNQLGNRRLTGAMAQSLLQITEDPRAIW